MFAFWYCIKLYCTLLHSSELRLEKRSWGPVDPSVVSAWNILQHNTLLYNRVPPPPSNSNFNSRILFVMFCYELVFRIKIHHKKFLIYRPINKILPAISWFTLYLKWWYRAKIIFGLERPIEARPTRLMFNLDGILGIPHSTVFVAANTLSGVGIWPRIWASRIWSNGVPLKKSSKIHKCKIKLFVADLQTIS